RQDQRDEELLSVAKVKVQHRWDSLQNGLPSERYENPERTGKRSGSKSLGMRCSWSALVGRLDFHGSNPPANHHRCDDYPFLSNSAKLTPKSECSLTE